MFNVGFNLYHSSFIKGWIEFLWWWWVGLIMITVTKDENDENDNTSQETLVWDMYQSRTWDFFPQGDCFRKQYETELGGGT